MKFFFDKLNLTPKQVLYLGLLVLIIIFIVQNMASVTVKFLFFGFQMPLIVIIVGVFIAGVLTSKAFTSKVKQVKDEIDEELNSKHSSQETEPPVQNT
jgi:uncharacterized integral membrane protein